jgi:peptide/nickel transport system permease protein
MEFKYYLIRRVLLQIIVVFGVVTITFFATKAIPGDPVAAMLGVEGMSDPRLVESVTKAWGLDKPVFEQYVIYIKNVLRGDFGRSLWSRNLVAKDLAARFPATVELAVATLFVGLAIAIPIGIISATHKDSVIDHGARIFSTIGVGAPSFWWGILLLLIFYLRLGILSSGRLSIQYSPSEIPFITGMYTVDSLFAGRFDLFLDALKHLILPAFALGFATNATLMRLTRSSMLEVLNSDYITAARMKGLPERIVIYRHALRNALLPTITYAGMLFGTLLGGSVLVETVFSWNGIGYYLVNAVFASDYPGILGVTIILAIVYTTCNLLVDLFYSLIDPRVRYG